MTKNSLSLQTRLMLGLLPKTLTSLEAAILIARIEENLEPKSRHFNFATLTDATIELFQDHNEYKS